MRAAGSRNVRFLTVGQTVRILGISCSTLRLWENVDLVTAARSAGSYRLYTPELQDVLKRIKYLRDVKKLNVPGIKEAVGSAAPINHPKPPRKPTPDLGDKLRRLRKKVSLTVTETTETAQRVQISPGFLSAIERLNCLAPTFCRYNLPIWQPCMALQSWNSMICLRNQAA
jgi:DNA-binding transcriptional MerR regulator